MKIWLKYPAFFYAIAIMGGIALYYRFPYLLICIFTHPKWHRKMGFLLIYCVSFGSYYAMRPPDPPIQKVKGRGYFELSSVRAQIFHGRPVLHYQGVMRGFETEGEFFYDLPVIIKVEKTQPDKARSYLIEGMLEPTGRGSFFMKDVNWTPMHMGKGPAHLRFELKNRLRDYLKRHIFDPEIYSLFASLGTGEIDNPLLGMQFNRLGLRHTLAISGFHYAYIIFILGFFLRLTFSKRVSSGILILLTTFYFFFIGETPSLNRAWIAALIYLFGILIHQASTGLNAFGVALIASLILDPDALFHIGFQLSYTATFAILTFFPYIERKLQWLLPKRTFKEAQELNRISQHGYILTSLLRQAAALTMSVNLFCLPLTLYHFHAFPLVSLLCNLFFPPVLSIGMILLILGLIIPWLGPLFLHLGEWYMSGWLSLVLYGTGRIRKFIIYGHFEALPVSLLLLSLSFLGLYLEEKRYQLTVIESQV